MQGLFDCPILVAFCGTQNEWTEERMDEWTKERRKEHGSSMYGHTPVRKKKTNRHCHEWTTLCIHTPNESIVQEPIQTLACKQHNDNVLSLSLSHKQRPTHHRLLNTESRSTTTALLLLLHELVACCRVLWSVDGIVVNDKAVLSSMVNAVVVELSFLSFLLSVKPNDDRLSRFEFGQSETSKCIPAE